MGTLRRPPTSRPSCLGILLGALALSGCQAETPKPDPLGTRIPVGTSELYYSADIQPADAKHVADVLAREKYLGDAPCSAHIRLVNRRYELRLVLRPGAGNKDLSTSLRALGDAVAQGVFRGSPVDTHLCDADFKTLKVVPH